MEFIWKSYIYIYKYLLNYCGYHWKNNDSIDYIAFVAFVGLEDGLRVNIVGNEKSLRAF